MSHVRPIPRGFHTVTPYLVVRDAAAAIDFYARAFDAIELYRSTCPSSDRIMNAKIGIGDSILMLHDEFPEYDCHGPSGKTPSPVTIHLYVEDVDRIFAQAIAAGATALMLPADSFWGDRFGQLTDPFGHKWSIGTHVEDVTEEEIERRARQAFG